MYKTASRNQQNVLRDRSTFKTSGDHYSFETGEQDKYDLIKRKKNYEQKLSDVKRKIGESVARAKGFREGPIAPDSQFKRWQLEAKELKDEIHHLENKLLDLRAERSRSSRKEEEEKGKRFERSFMKAAKALLASPIYDRIVAVAIQAASRESQN